MKTFATAGAIASLALLTEACILPEELANGGEAVVKRQTGNTGLAIGTGNRFANGTVPRGLGTQPPGTNLETLLNVGEITAAVQALVDEYDLESFIAPVKTYEGAEIVGAKVGGQKNCSSSYHVYFNGAIHARERGSSDNIIYFISDLLYANKHNTGLQYGGRTYTNCDVRRALAAGIVFTPLSNPDGVAWDQSTNTCWRKNRNPAAAVAGNPASVGVDLNRNFDVVFDFLNKFHPEVGPNVASKNPRAQTYQGASAFSEAETQAIKWVMDEHENLRWYMDVHAYAGVLLYASGIDELQSRHPEQNFLNSTYDNVRGLMPDDPQSGAVYGEYITQKDWSDKSFAAMRSVNAMDAATGRHYEAMSAAYLYPTSGASDDYAWARHQIDPSLNKLHGYCLEFGFGNTAASCAFYPTSEIYHQNALETGAGFMEFLLAATEIGLGEEGTC
ncbi:peptidase M14 [Verticillium alfalfae VaMs.102]|uniref:Peptidase M14 n=1 Tax=Verticillium alfalfae (strain VaMs.102 / ATCC MYA-4576 / FGSC 10136) TaxID=526221 RepID=C9SVV4_VERA1|nr:peptidase M14 [Verticillium alfalfae VaMs.102]EEY22919.1 peptidase M14 [Verticillium alfalfae VaMs.102]